MKHIKNNKRIRDKQSIKDYAGTEASPYQEWLETKGDYKQEHEAEEPPEANPDQLMEEEGLWFSNPEINDEQMEKVKKALPHLSDLQKQILQLVGYEGKTMENVGAILGISKQAVNQALQRAKRIIKAKRS